MAAGAPGVHSVIADRQLPVPLLHVQISTAHCKCVQIESDPQHLPSQAPGPPHASSGPKRPQCCLTF